MEELQVSSDLKRAYEALSGKQAHCNTYWSYYDGVHPMVYSAERLRQVFGSELTKFSENWCAVVIDSEIERIELREITVSKNETATSRLAELMESTGLGLDAEDIHKASLVCGEAFLFIWREEAEEVEAYYNDPRLAHAFYDEENPRKMSFAAKWWVGSDGKRYLNLYYPDHFEYYVSQGKSEDVNAATSFMATEEGRADNPKGKIPVFHFRTERRTIKSELVNVIEPQDAINKLFADMMVAAEFAAFLQRWVISNADLKKLKSAPNEIWKIPASDGAEQNTEVGEFSAVELKNFLDAMDKLANTIAVITRTPKHYVFSQSGDPSGEALIAMEAPLNKKAAGHIKRWLETWRAAAAFLLELDGAGEIKQSEIMPVFARPETVQPRTTAEIVEINVRSGIPLRLALRREGWTDAEIKALDAEPPDKAELIEMANDVADHLDDLTYLKTVAPAFGWNEQMVKQIAAGLALERELKARAEARGFAEGIFGADDEGGEGDGSEEAEENAASRSAFAYPGT